MSINYPTTLDSLSNPTSTDLLDNASPSLDHWTQHSDANDAIEALEAKVGVNGSAVTTSFDYKLGEVTSTDKAVGKTATQTLTNKTLTSPTITGATISGATATTTSVNGVTLSTGSGTSNFLRGDGTYAAPTAGDASYAAKGSIQGLTDAATSGLTIASGVISVNSGTSANNIVKLDASAKLPAVDGSQLTGIPVYVPNTDLSTTYLTWEAPVLISGGTAVIGWTATGGFSQASGGAGYARLADTASEVTISTPLPGTGSTNGYAYNKKIRLKFRIRFEDTSDRKGFGMCTGVSDIHGPQTNTTNGLVRFILNTTTLYAQNANGTTATSTDISSGVTVTNWNIYEIVFDPGVDIKYYINGTLKATHTTNLPSSGTGLLSLGSQTNGKPINTAPVMVSVEI